MVTVNGGGTLDINAQDVGVEGLTLDSGSVIGTGVLTATSPYLVESGSISAILSGANVGLQKTTSGTVTLSVANTYTGATTVRTAR